MKFHFQFDIAGAKKSDANGVSKIWDGAKMNLDVEAEVSEIVQVAKDRQLSFDKILNFVRQDLPNSIRNCGSAFLDLEKANRKMNAEMPSNGMKSLIEENKKLREHIKELNDTNNELHNSWDQEHDNYMDEHINKLSAYEQRDNFKKQLEEKECQFNSLRADMEGTCKTLEETRSAMEKYKRQYEYIKTKYLEENPNATDYTVPGEIQKKIF